MDSTKFFGSQVGGRSVINYSYTDMPLKLLMWDTYYFFVFIWALPWVVWPLRPCDGGHFNELEFNRKNVWCLAVHGILLVCQISFIIALPLACLLPVWMFALALAVFLTFNWLLCKTLNGNTIVFHSDPEFAPGLPDHQHEEWIFINGVACGETWLRSNINRLALTFGRPVTGIHNQTSGIIFDVFECLVQRNFGLATRDIREAYKIVKEKLYDPSKTKIVFIMHSQGGIEGGLVLDWLLQELPQDLLAKLEVYTFGNAANHFNNPHRHNLAQDIQSQEPDNAALESEKITETPGVPISESPTDLRTPATSRAPSLLNGSSQVAGMTRTPAAAKARRSTHYTAPTIADRAIGHVEHYAHTTDFVALWGVLHFVTNDRATASMPRFIGRIFSRTSSRGGHQFSQHYLDGMFPLERDADGAFVGCADTNPFMDSVVESLETGTEQEQLREGVENSWARLRQDSGLEGGVAVQESFHGVRKDEISDGKVRVRDLSRLWQYRNGKSPPELPCTLLPGGPGEASFMRGSTL